MLKRIFLTKGLHTEKGRKNDFNSFLLILIYITLFSFVLQSCKSPIAPSSKSISISIDDVTCTEAWITLNANNITLPANIIVKKNGNNFLNLILTNKDTTLFDSTLSPNQAYTYQAVSGINKSEIVTAKTMDTSSSNFTWQTFTFGGGGESSAIYDASIISPNDIWACGEIYINDSTGKPDPLCYKAVH